MKNEHENDLSNENLKGMGILLQSDKEAEILKQAEKRKVELKANILHWLTREPEVLENELISSFFLIASQGVTDERTAAFQSLWFIITDAKELKNLMNNEG